MRQRADRYNEIGKPKSHAGERTVPLPKFVVNTLKEWKLACPKSELDLVFPNGAGKVESLANIINRGLIPAQGEQPKYTGMHVFRHFYASAGASTRACRRRSSRSVSGTPRSRMTYDRYGHLFPRGDDIEASSMRLPTRCWRSTDILPTCCYKFAQIPN